MLFTFIVFHRDKLGKDFKEQQLLKRKLISFMFDEFQLDILGKDIKLIHPENK